jgi:hypothetical protein
VDDSSRSILGSVNEPIDLAATGKLRNRRAQFVASYPNNEDRHLNLESAVASASVTQLLQKSRAAKAVAN